MLGADLGLEQDLAHGPSDDHEPLLDARAARLGGLGPVRLGDQLVTLASQALQLAHLPEEGLGPFVLLALGALGRLGLRLVVAEDVPRLDLPAAELLSERQHVLERQVEREHGLAHLALAALDLLGDRDLLLAREEGHAAHLLEVHAHRVGGLAGRALGRFLGLGLLLGPLGLDRLFRLLGQRRLLDRRVDLDVHVAEHRDDLVELLGRRAVGGDLALVARLGGGGGRPRQAGPGRLRLLLFDSLLLALHASPPRGELRCGARVDGLRQGLSRCWEMGLPGCPNRTVRRDKATRGYGASASQPSRGS